MILSPKQAHVLDLLQDDHTTEVLAGGGAGGGKSRIMAYWLIKMALMYPESRWLLGRNELKRLKETILVTFLQVARVQGLMVNTHFKLNMQDNFIHFRNGSHIILRDCKFQPSDPEFEDFGSTLRPQQT